ncbi:MAG: nucleoside deaminase, partial [Thermoplasmata archaeon]
MNNEFFMKKAIEDAKAHGHHFGAVIVKDNKIIAKAGKRPRGDARFHAETQAILKACKKLKTRTLKGCILYATCEPCPMCFYMAWITNISKIVYGATLQDSIKYGFPEIEVTAKFLNERSGNKIELKDSFMRDEC